MPLSDKNRNSSATNGSPFVFYRPAEVERIETVRQWRIAHAIEMGLNPDPSLIESRPGSQAIFAKGRDGKVAGICEWIVRKDPQDGLTGRMARAGLWSNDMCYVGTLIVARQYRRHSFLAAALFKEVAQKLSDQRFKAVVAGVLSDDVAVCRLYERRGAKLIYSETTKETKLSCHVYSLDLSDYLARH